MSEIQTFYTYLRTEQGARDYLFRCYKPFHHLDPEKKSYENAQAFLYYLDHGLRLYDNGRHVDLFFKPVLYFYGMVHLLKACLLTVRPEYPESASLLAHGVSTRKKKKKNYTFMNDEVKVQVQGLFPYFTKHLYSKQLLSFEKLSMKQLLALIPEMNRLFSFFRQKSPMVIVGSTPSNVLTFPDFILDCYQLTTNTFLRKLRYYLPEIETEEVKQGTIKLHLKKPIDCTPGPFFIHSQSNNIYFPRTRHNYLPIAEVMIHYLLLYNLSMLARYETEWWGDLFATKPDEDYSFITHFLTITAEKMPHMLGCYLLKQPKI